MDSIRLDSGVKKIEVNDAGEYISINLSNNQIFSEFNRFFKWLDEKQVELDQEEKALHEKYVASDNEAPESAKVEMYLEVAEIYKKLCDDVAERLDGLFGKGCLRKVFPDVESPGMELIYDFLDAVTPFLERFATERNEKINAKYNRSRKGARKV